MPFTNPEDQRRAARKHYEANMEAMKARAAAQRKKTRIEIRRLIQNAKDRPCADCKVAYPYYVMQFDHVGEKEFTIGAYSRNVTSAAKVLAEIERCEVVCANCHAERTHKRGETITVRVSPRSDSANDLTLF